MQSQVSACVWRPDRYFWKLVSLAMWVLERELRTSGMASKHLNRLSHPAGLSVRSLLHTDLVFDPVLPLVAFL